MDIEQSIDELRDDCKRFDLEMNELKTVVLGPPPNRSNGLNGKLNALIKKVDDAVEWANNIWNVKRREECIGLVAIQALEERLEKQQQEDSQVKVANVNLKGVYIMGVLQFIGLIVVAVIGLF